MSRKNRKKRQKMHKRAAKVNAAIERVINPLPALPAHCPKPESFYHHAIVRLRLNYPPRLDSGPTIHLPATTEALHAMSVSRERANLTKRRRERLRGRGNGCATDARMDQLYMQSIADRLLHRYGSERISA